MVAVRRAVIALIVLVGGSACDRSPTAAAPDPVAANPRRTVANSAALLSCKPLGYDSATQTVGPAGGVIKISKHNLVVPAGPSLGVVSITAVATADTVHRAELRPERITFSQAAGLTL